MNELILLNTFFLFLLFKCCLSVPFIFLSRLYIIYSLLGYMKGLGLVG